MKKILILLLLITPTFAQQIKNPVQQKIEATIGSLMVENASLNVKIEELQQKIKELEDREKKISEQKDKLNERPNPK